MKKLFHIAFLFVCISSNAQNVPFSSIFGKVVDSVSLKPLSGVSFILVDSLTRKTLESRLSNSKGDFEFSRVLDNRTVYQLTFTYTGYSSKVIFFKANSPVVDLGNLLLNPVTIDLQGVTVKSTRPLISQEVDRLVYDVQADPQAKNQSTLDVLSRVPLLTVDANENLLLQGESNYRIFIDGKPSALVANNPKEVLRAIPSSTIAKIEVITTPPAKYEAEGLGGIINIVTLKRKSDGYSGNIVYRLMSPESHSLSVSTNSKIGKWGSTLFSSYSIIPERPIPTYNERKTYGISGVNLSQSGQELYSENTFVGGVEFSYESDSLNLFTSGINYSNSKGNDHFDRYSITKFNSGIDSQFYRSFLNQHYHNQNIDLSFNYQKGFAKAKDALLTFSYHFSNSQSFHSGVTSFLEKSHFLAPDFTQMDNAGSKEHTFQIDYFLPHKNIVIESGIKAIFRTNYSLANGENKDPSLGVFLMDPLRFNQLDYHLSIYSLYNSYQWKMKQWTLKAGIRGELTTLDADFVSTNTVLSSQYSNLIPTLSIVKVYSNRQSIGLAFSTRLSRPGIFQLNPFVNRNNPELFTTGNPKLQPVVSHLVDLTYSIPGKRSITNKLSYFSVNNNIESVLRIVDDSTSLTGFENVGESRILRYSFNALFPISNKLNLTVNTGLFYVWIKGVYNGKQYSNEGPRTNTYVSFGYKPSENWQFYLNGGYNRRYIRLQGGSNDYPYYSFSGSHSMNRFTLSATVNNLFSKNYLFTEFSDTPDFYQSVTWNLYYRVINLSLSYKFGSLKTAIKKNKRAINNDDSVGSGN